MYLFVLIYLAVIRCLDTTFSSNALLYLHQYAMMSTKPTEYQVRTITEYSIRFP